MPSRTDAFRFVSDPATSHDQLRQAREILGLDSGGPLEILRARLIEHVRTLNPIEPVVCLNPSPAGATPPPRKPPGRE